MFDSRATNRSPLPSAWIGAARQCWPAGSRSPPPHVRFAMRSSATLSQQRDASAVVVLVEATDKAVDNAAGNAGEKSDSSTVRRQSFRIHAVLKGKKRLGDVESLRVAADAPLKEGSLAIAARLGRRRRRGRSICNGPPFRSTKSAYGYFFREPPLSDAQSRAAQVFCPLSRASQSAGGRRRAAGICPCFVRRHGSGGANVWT